MKELFKGIKNAVVVLSLTVSALNVNAVNAKIKITKNFFIFELD